MLDGIVWLFQNIAMAFANLATALLQPGSWLSWVGTQWSGFDTTEQKQALMRFIYYGGSTELFFVAFTIFLVCTAIGLWRSGFMWGCVRALEAIGNTIGRLFAWAGLIMVIQQIVIVFIQRIFASAEISFGLGPVNLWTRDVSWWAEELKLFNAMVVALCLTYTFVQGGHVRVDLVYSKISFRKKRVIDMLGSLFFMMPVAVVTWMYAWFFMWRHLVVPNPSASDTLERLLAKARALRWNVEHTGFSPNGYDQYWIFKVLLVTMAGLIFLQAIAFFYRSLLEFREGEGSEGKYLSKDTLGAGEEAYEGTH